MNEKRSARPDMITQKLPRPSGRRIPVPVGIGAAVLLLIVIIAAIISMATSGRRVSKDSTQEGIAYIQTQEGIDVTSIEKKIKEVSRAERKEALSGGDVDVWRMLDDTVIMGDSRAVGFSYHEFIESRRVLAAGGATIRDIPDQVETVSLLNPSSIFLCYGLNDISIGHWETVEEYIAELDTALAQLQAAVPDATIYVNSIIPLAGAEFAQASKWLDIPDWNVQIRQHCEENGIPYLDITDEIAAHSDLYDSDGIHLQKEFYQYWAIDMVMEENEYE